MASADDNDVDGDLLGGRKRHRSPNHPSVDLQKALELAEKILNDDGTRPIPIAVAHDRWNYKRHSAGANQLVAALKSYGLMDVSGVGEKRSVRITESARRIIKKAPNREQLIQEAALLPDIHLELWEKYKESGGLPKDDVLKEYLHWGREAGTFNEDAIDNFIANLRTTFRLAGIEHGDKIEEEDSGHDETEQPDHLHKNVDKGRTGALTPEQRRRAKMPGIKEDVYTLDSGDAVLQWPNRITPEEYEELEDWLDLMRKKLKRSIVKDPNEVFDQPGPVADLVNDIHKHIRERPSSEEAE